MQSEPQDIEPIFEIPSEDVIEQRVIHFAGDDVILARCISGIYISIPGMCRAVGLHTNSQIRHMLNINRLRVALRKLSLRTRGGFQAITCLNVEDVPNWLIGIENAKAKPAFQAKMDEYYDKLKPQAQQAFADVMGIALKEPSPSTQAAIPIPQQTLDRLLELAETYHQVKDITHFV